MIVEDDEIGLRCLGRLLKKRFQVATALDGNAALAQLDAFQPDLVLADLSASTRDLLAQVHERLPGCCRMTLAWPLDPLLPDADIHRATKPWRNGELLAQVAQILA